MSSFTMKKLATFTLVVALMAPSAAFASSGQQGYGGNNLAGLQQGNGNGPGSSSGTSPDAQKAQKAQTANTGSTLPFTGADLGVLAVAGGALMALGVGLRRLTQSPSQA